MIGKPTVVMFHSLVRSSNSSRHARTSCPQEQYLSKMKLSSIHEMKWLVLFCFKNINTCIYIMA
jgi:hypothetical protein